MTPERELRYLRYKEEYLKQVSHVWRKHLQTLEAFQIFFHSITPDGEQDLFLRIGSFYRYLVVEGTFRFPIGDWNKGMSYIDDTYKYIAIFSLIEALETPPKFKDFYQWIKSQHKNVPAPSEKLPLSLLDDMYKEYKTCYGSVQAAVRFFGRLDDKDQSLIQQKLRVRGKVTSLKQLAQLLYEFRSDFVHKGAFVLGFGERPTVSRHRGKVIINDLNLEDIKRLFERGFLKRFQSNSALKHALSSDR